MSCCFLLGYFIQTPLKVLVTWRGEPRLSSETVLENVKLVLEEDVPARQPNDYCLK